MPISTNNLSHRPGEKCGLGGHKTASTATGVEGVVSWTLGTTGKMLVIMYSCPYSHDFHSNWMAVGIFEPEDTTNYFDKMYYGTETEYFKRKAFWNDADPIFFDDGKDFIIEAGMGQSHKPTIKVILSIFYGIKF